MVQLLKSLQFSLPVLLTGIIYVTPFALETPYTAYKDGYATSSTYTGNSRALIVRSDCKAWLSHAFADGSGKGLQSARIQVYVKDIMHDGLLKFYLAPALGTLENQTHFSDLMNKDSVGSIQLKAIDHIQHMVEIPLNAAFVKALQDNAYSGLILESVSGLDAELGALEGDHGAVAFLNYNTSTTVVTANVISVDSLANKLFADHQSELRGPAGTNGSNGAKGDGGLNGVQGIKGDKGDKGDIGPPGPIGLPGAPGKDGAAGTAGTGGSTTSLPATAITGLPDFITAQISPSLNAKANLASPTFTGRIGIGTTITKGFLDVQGGTAVVGNGASIILNAQKGGAAADGGNVVINSGENGSGGKVGNILFSTGGIPDSNGAAAYERLRINGTGEIGMGGIYPGVPLTISRTGGVPAILRVQGNSTQNAPLTALELRHVNSPVAGNVGQAVDIDMTIERLDLGAQVVAAKIRAGKEEDFTTLGKADSYLGISTSKDGVVSEKVRVTGNGELVTGSTVLLNGMNTSSTGAVVSTKTLIDLDGPQDILRFLKNGNVFGNQAIVGHLYVHSRASAGGTTQNNQSNILTVLTTGNGISDATCSSVATQTRATTPILSISCANDSTLGSIKFQLTRKTGAGQIEVFATFAGTVQ